jgi:hypothetical protein
MGFQNGDESQLAEVAVSATTALIAELQKPKQ